MKKFLIAMCFVATVFDGIGTLLGLAVATKAKTEAAYAFNAIGALMIVALVLSTRDIWHEDDNLHKTMRPFWGLALFVSFCAVLLAGFNHVLLENPIIVSTAFDWYQVKESALLQKITVCVLTLFVACAPIALSYQWKHFFADDDEPVPAPKPGDKATV